MYYLGIGNLLRGLNADIDKDKRAEHVRRMGEVGHLMMDAGLIVIATASDLEAHELSLLKTIIHQDDMIRIYIDSGSSLEGDVIDLELMSSDDAATNAERIVDLLKNKNIMFSI